MTADNVSDTAALITDDDRDATTLISDATILISDGDVTTLTTGYVSDAAILITDATALTADDVGDAIMLTADDVGDRRWCRRHLCTKHERQRTRIRIHGHRTLKAPHPV